MNIKLNIFLCIYILCCLNGIYVKAVCDESQAEYEGRCFDTLAVARDKVFNVTWEYNFDISSADNSLIQDIDSAVREQFIAFSDFVASYARGKTICPSVNCSGLVVSISEAGESRTLVELFIEDVTHFISEQQGGIFAHGALQTAGEDGSFDIEINGQLLDAESFEITGEEYYCDPGEELIGDGFAVCGGCLPGQYHDKHGSKQCTPCPRGTYQPMARQSACQSCPDGESTQEEGQTTSWSCEAVILMCDPGYYIKNVNTVEECTPCEFGRYYPTQGTQTSCLPCSNGNTVTTYGTASTSSGQCFDVCDRGYKMSIRGECSPCTQGTYLSTPFIDRECNHCPDNLTTDGQAAMAEADCINVICPAGQEREGSNPGICKPCAQGFYKTDDMEDCASCGDPAKYRTDQNGSTSLSDCKFYCPAGQYIVTDNGEYCSECPQDTYKVLGEYYATVCAVCPADAPKTLGSGSESPDDCKYARCSAGEQINPDDFLQCLQCDFGLYQSVREPITEQCQSCDDMYSTRQQGSTSANQCEKYCDSGYEVISGDQCSPCIQGHYKDNSKGMDHMFGKCELCPLEFVTDGMAATSENDCTRRNCSEGYFVTDSNTCQKCAHGQYQNLRFQLECKPCPNQETTTAQEGATGPEYCTGPCMLQADKGNCTGHFRRWYFDHNAGKCKRFIYGGCEGNANRFRRKRKCKRKCKDFFG